MVELSSEELLIIDGGGWVSQVMYYGFTGGTSAIGGFAGASLGSLVTPVAGTAVGATAGALAGNKAGDAIWNAITNKVK